MVNPIKVDSFAYLFDSATIDRTSISKAALLFWLLSDFRCGVPLFIVILVIYKYRNR